MNYLLFDIECVYDKQEQYMLSFGYVKTDKDFNVIKREDILINPNLTFSLTDVGVPVYYTIREILNSPIFPEVYHKIKSLLEEKDQYVIGHAIMNDVNYLVDECISYELDGFNFSFFDAQIIYCLLNNETRRVSLDNILLNLGIARSNLHRSDEDAYHTMLYLQAMCKQKGMTLDQLFKETKAIPGMVREKEIVEPILLDWVKSTFLSDEFKQIALKEGLKKINVSSVGKLKGKTFGFNTGILYRDLDYSLYLIYLISKEGGAFKQDSEVDYCIYEYNDCPYQERLSISEYWMGDFITIDELCTRLGINEEDIKESSKDYFKNLICLTSGVY